MTVSRREEEYLFSAYKEFKRCVFAELTALALPPENILKYLCIYTVVLSPQVVAWPVGLDVRMDPGRTAKEAVINMRIRRPLQEGLDFVR